MDKSRDSVSPPPDRIEHALRTLRDVRDELKNVVSKLEQNLQGLSSRAEELDTRSKRACDDINELRDTLAELKRKLSRESLHDAETEAEQVRKLAAFETDLARLKAAGEAAEAAVRAGGDQALRRVNDARRAGTQAGLVSAVAAFISAGALLFEHLGPVLKAFWNALTH